MEEESPVMDEDGNDEAGDIGDGMGGGIGDGTDDGTGSSSGGGVGASTDEGSGYGDTWGDTVEAQGIAAVAGMDSFGTNTPGFNIQDNTLQALKDNPDINPYHPNYAPTMKIGNVVVQGRTDVGQANQDAQDALEGMNWGDTQHSDGAAFPSMYDPAPPVVEQPVIQPPVTQPGPTTSYEDSILFHFTPQERHSYLLNQIEMGMAPTRGYTGPDGIFVDLTTVYPDIFSAPSDYVTLPDIDRPSIPDPLAKVGDWNRIINTNPDYDYDNIIYGGLPPGTRDPKTGRIYSQDTSWLIPPPAGSLNTMVHEPHIHPITGEIAYANTGGWTIDPEIYNQLKTEGDGVGSGRNLDGGFIDVGHIRGDLGGDGVLPRMTLGDPGGYEFDPVTGDYIDGGGGYKYGGYVDDYRMNRGGIMDLREPHLYNRGGNVMRNIRDEQARVIGVQDNAADQMNRIRYHSGRDARDERFRVAARERDARAEMGRLRGEARYEDMHGRGPRAFNQGGVASLAPVARDMFRKRRLPRAGMVV